MSIMSVELSYCAVFNVGAIADSFEGGDGSLAAVLPLASGVSNDASCSAELLMLDPGLW